MLRKIEEPNIVGNQSIMHISLLENVDHSKTKANSPQDPSICERFHKTIQEECYFFRKKIYKSLEELQIDVDQWLQPSEATFRQMPMQTFLDTKHIAQNKNLRYFRKHAK